MVQNLPYDQFEIYQSPAGLVGPHQIVLDRFNNLVYEFYGPTWNKSDAVFRCIPANQISEALWRILKPVRLNIPKRSNKEIHHCLISKLGQRGWKGFTNNCQHNAFECVYGIRYSETANTVILAGLLLGLGGLALYSGITGKI